MKFTCAYCREEHDLSEISLGAEAPAQWGLLSGNELKNSQLTPEQCVIKTKDGIHYFIRACLDIPINGTEQSFTWGVWCSLSEASYLEISEHWENPARVNMGPYFGWLCTRVPEYPDTMFLKTHVHNRAVGQRPLVELEQTDHPLSIHQNKGISVKDLQGIVQEVLHKSAQPENQADEK